MDVVTFFLNNELIEVHMEQTKVYEEGETSHLILFIQKYIYGLKQAPREWYENIYI